MKYTLTQEQVELIYEALRALTLVTQEDLDEVRYNTPSSLMCEGIAERECELQGKLRAITALQNLFEQQEKELSMIEGLRMSFECEDLDCRTILDDAEERQSLYCLAPLD